MIPRAVPAPTIPIAFLAAIVDATNEDTKRLVERIAGERFKVDSIPT